MRQVYHVYEHESALWADKMIKCLMNIKAKVDQDKLIFERLEPDCIIYFENI